MIVLGAILTGHIIWHWIVTGFGPLEKYRMLFLALLCLVNGTQIGAPSYLFSIMALPRHIDQLPPQATETGIPNSP